MSVFFSGNGVTNYDHLGEVHNVMAADGWTEISAPAFIPIGGMHKLYAFKTIEWNEPIQFEWKGFNIDIAVCRI